MRHKMKKIIHANFSQLRKVHFGEMTLQKYYIYKHIKKQTILKKYAITGHFLDGQTGNNQLLTRNTELVQRNSCVQSEHKHEIIQQIPKHTSHTHQSKI